jgi:hypothetical protein
MEGTLRGSGKNAGCKTNMTGVGGKKISAEDPLESF